VVATHPKTPEAEAFRSLRTALTLLRTDEERKSVLFTSAVPGEGKSYCSTNYATAIAQQGFRTLLIDGDLRRPRLRRVFAKSSRQPGLSDCLHDPRLFPQTVHATTVPNLFVVGDPRGTHRGLELMGRENLQLVLQLAYGGFDRVVIDTAPLTAVSDALYFAQHVSTVCLVIHAGRTPRRTVRRACKLLAEVAKKTPAGVVLNQIRGGRASRYYYYSDSEYYVRGAAPVAVPG
jgi:capsular exopolysaccharide synthesis family protein